MSIWRMTIEVQLTTHATWITDSMPVFAQYRNYSHEVRNIQQRLASLNISYLVWIIPNIKQKGMDVVIQISFILSSTSIVIGQMFMFTDFFYLLTCEKKSKQVSN